MCLQVKGILEELPASRQTLMFSATVPGWVSSLARRMMKDPVTVVVGEVSRKGGEGRGGEVGVQEGGVCHSPVPFLVVRSVV